MEPVLVFFFKVYSKLKIISVGVSGFSSSFILYYLLTISTTDYCSKEFIYDFDLRKSFYTR